MSDYSKGWRQIQNERAQAQARNRGCADAFLRSLLIVLLVIVIALLGLVTAVLMVERNAAGSEMGPMFDPTPPANHVRVCYVFDPRLDDDLLGSYFDPPAWVSRWVPESSVSSYEKTRLGTFVMAETDHCPRTALFLMRVVRD